MAVRAVLFDMDGTLIHVKHLWRDLLFLYLKPYGVALDDAQFETAMTLSYDALAEYLNETCALGKTPRLVMDEIDALALDVYADLAILKDGAAEYIKTLYEKGIILAIVTTNLGEIAKAVLKRFSLFEYFTAVYGAYELVVPKRNPACFIDIAGRLGVSPNECLVFEDSSAVAYAARNAGMNVIGVIGEQTELEKERLSEIAAITISDYFERME